jgi:hypothetical protein
MRLVVAAVVVRNSSISWHIGADQLGAMQAGEHACKICAYSQHQKLSLAAGA